MILRSRRKLLCSLALVSTVSLYASAAAIAGFEWVPQQASAAPAPVVEGTETLAPALPTDTPQQAQAGLLETLKMTPPPIDTGTASAVEPMAEDITNAPDILAPKKLMTSEKRIDLPTQQQASITKVDMPILKPLTKAAPASATTQQQKPAMGAQSNLSSLGNGQRLESVMGFGSDMPLALALQQVVPPQYTYSFSPDVNLGSRASWNGGQSWDKVLIDMLKPLSLTAKIRNNALFITTQTPGDMVMHSPSATTPPATKPAAKAAPEMSAVAHEKNVIMNFVTLEEKESMPASQPNEAMAPVQLLQMNATAATPMPVSSQRARVYDPGETAGTQPARMVEKAVPTAINTGSSKFAINPHPFGQKQNTVKTWEANKGDSLKTILEQWSAKENIQLVWDASHDYTLSSSLYLQSDLKTALDLLSEKAFTDESRPNILYVQPSANSASKTIIVKDHSA